jgi:ABC-type lipoprotein export system ATPase subunit
VGGRSTRAIATDTEWLASLDRFGIVTERAVLLDTMTLAANLALPLTLEIDPVPPITLARVRGLAAEAGLDPSRLDAPVTALTSEERVRTHLARALASDPDILLLEHPTARLAAADSPRIGETLKEIARTRGLGWIALTEDERFARAAGGRRLRLQAATGVLAEDGLWRRLLS